MAQLIKQFEDSSYLEYDRGNFDDWCVYYTNSQGHRKPPRDTDYFEDLKRFSQKYGVDRIYGDYVEVYNLTNKEISRESLSKISSIACTYNEDSLQIDVIFSILYMAMIAEERKAHTRLGKRIKRLGIHKLLIENKSTYEAANFMRGMRWRDISELCEERGF